MRLSDYELERRYCEFLDEVYGECTIAGYSYGTSRALAQVDPVAFRCGFSDWLDSEIGENIFEKAGEYFGTEPSESEES